MFLIFWVFENIEGKCVFRQNCGLDPEGLQICGIGNNLNCHYTGDPIKLKSQEYYQKLWQACPHFL